MKWKKLIMGLGGGGFSLPIFPTMVEWLINNVN